jgi:cell division protein FtsL
VNRLHPVLLIAILAATTGCATVQPWERDLHAREDMQPNQRDAAIDDHIYFSKEASSGGRGFAGGGCGCN